MKSRRTRLSNKSNTKNSVHKEDSQNSPDDGSVITPGNKNSVYQLNKQIQDQIKDKSQRVYDNVNDRQLGQNTLMGRFVRGLKEAKKMAAILEFEYETTNKSDAKGNIT